MSNIQNSIEEDAILAQASVAGETNHEQNGDLYRIWASDNLVYGPVPLTVLAEWAVDGRLFRDTWVYSQSAQEWRPAGGLPALARYLPVGSETIFLEKQALEPNGVDPYELRTFPIFAGLSNSELANFIRLGESLLVNAGKIIVRRRDPGDAIFFVLAGEARAQISVGAETKLLNTIAPGEFFGEMAMFTHAARSADVVASQECKLLKFSAGAFQELIARQPASAAPMLYSIASTMAQRIMNANVRLQQEVASGFVWR